ncbi:AAA family ATPase [Austwickia chelonae]|uniref:AAA family ATPase n=1 Tax=Austwickia chelonae TaxID=100225 RepID=UPI001160B456|nr:MoxR family ATPase [Austwickia chelonae]
MVVKTAEEDPVPHQSPDHPSARPLGAPLPPLADEALVAVTARALHQAVTTVVTGKDHAVDIALTVLFAGGHLLIEDVPGMAKTTLATTLGAAMGASPSRIQFTPDLLPSDITGISVLASDERRFEFRPGPIFSHVVICDEINRASPKTQSAVLECMQEGQVSVDGHTYPLDLPFLVVATQNPVEMEGTYPLPEAQRDRFMARLSMGYPSKESERLMLEAHGGTSPMSTLRAVTDPPTIRRAIEATGRVHAGHEIQRYIVELVSVTRVDERLRLGASPRASLHLLRAARSRAAICGRHYVLPDDVQDMFLPVIAHRVLLSGQAQRQRIDARHVLMDLLERTPVDSA